MSEDWRDGLLLRSEQESAEMARARRAPSPDAPGQGEAGAGGEEWIRCHVPSDILAAHDASVVAAARADAEGRLGERIRQKQRELDNHAADMDLSGDEHAWLDYRLAAKFREATAALVLDAAGPREGEHQAADSPRRPNEAG